MVFFYLFQLFFFQFPLSFKVQFESFVFFSFLFVNPSFFYFFFRFLFSCVECCNFFWLNIGLVFLFIV
jgi:hypothetical protein